MIFEAPVPAPVPAPASTTAKPSTPPAPTTTPPSPPVDANMGAGMAPMDMGIGGMPDAAAATTPQTEKRYPGNPKDKVATKKLISPEKINIQSLSQIKEDITLLQTEIAERQIKISSLLNDIDFLEEINYTSDSQFKEKIQDFIILNKTLSSDEYKNLSPTNLYSRLNAVKANLEMVKKNKEIDSKEIIKYFEKNNFEKNL
jgi:hypothetical protein